MATTIELVGPNAVVTGVSGGIGRATAVALARAGANVLGVYRSNHEGADLVRSQIEAAGREAIIIQGDTGDSELAPALSRAALERWGSVDIWVNNAASLMVKPLIDTTDEDWHGLMAANLHGFFYGSREAARVMYGQGRGRIINVTSAADILVVANLGAYIAAKGGVHALTLTAAAEYSARGVRVNSVAPGGIDTPAIRRYFDKFPEFEQQTVNTHAMRRLGRPEEVAEPVVWLASDRASFVTGSCISCDGGVMVNSHLL